MDGTTSTVNYLLSPMPNDYYDHHAFQPIQSLTSVPYYQSDAIDCFYDHQKVDFRTSTTYNYQPIQQTHSFSYGSSIYEVPSEQTFVQEPSFFALQNPPRSQPTFEMIIPQTTIRSGQTILKREIEDTNPSTTTTTNAPMPSDKNQVYEWMKGK